jgi:hypothetical protein
MKKYVKVKFDSNEFGKEYVFKNDIDGLAVGNKVVVDTQYGLSVATVRDLMDVAPDGIKATKFVVQVIDMKAHEERLHRERNLNEVKKKMEKRRKELEEINLYAILAKEDTEMARLLTDYQTLNI